MSINIFANVLVLGSSRSGKSEMIKHLLPFYSTWQVVIMSDVAQYNHEYDQVRSTVDGRLQTAEILEINDTGFARLNAIAHRQAVYVKRGHRGRRVLFLLDDAISEDMDYSFLGKLMSRNRHLQIKIIISTQAIQASIKPLGRYNLHLLFLGNISTESAKYVYPCVGSAIIDTEKKFVDLYHEMAEPYHFIRFNCSDPRQKPRLVNSREVKRLDLVN